MAGITLAQAETNLAAANAAYLKALDVQSYTTSGRTKTNQDIEKLRQQIVFWEGKVALLSSTYSHRPISIKGITPC
jgi:hypothetical protein